MTQRTIPGLHHVTAISGPPQQNVDFFTKLMGQRLVKKTVNFDDLGTYHLYYGNKSADPGTILTFFPFADAGPGAPGRAWPRPTHILSGRGPLAIGSTGWRIRRLTSAGRKNALASG